MSWDKETAYLYSRQRRMPEMVELAEKKLLALYREATRYNMRELMEEQSKANAAWDRATMLAYLENKEFNDAS